MSSEQIFGKQKYSSSSSVSYSYSSNLSSYDYFLFPKIKTDLRGRHLETIENMKNILKKTKPVSGEVSRSVNFFVCEWLPEETTLIDWLILTAWQHVEGYLSLEVWESRSLCAHIYIFVLFLKRCFFCMVLSNAKKVGRDWDKYILTKHFIYNLPSLGQLWHKARNMGTPNGKRTDY